jgi:hypothetical protein
MLFQDFHLSRGILHSFASSCSVFICFFRISLITWHSTFLCIQLFCLHMLCQDFHLSHGNLHSFASSCSVSLCSFIHGKSNMLRVGQNHTYTVYIQYFWQGNRQIYGHIRCVYTVLANPKYAALYKPAGPCIQHSHAHKITHYHSPCLF